MRRHTLLFYDDSALWDRWRLWQHRVESAVHLPGSPPGKPQIYEAHTGYQQMTTRYLEYDQPVTIARPPAALVEPTREPRPFPTES